MTHVLFDQCPAVGMILGQVRQRFGIAQCGEAVAATPEPGRRAGVPEQAVVLLGAGGEQELGEQVEVARLAGEPEGAAQHGAVHEHVLGAKIWRRTAAARSRRCWAGNGRPSARPNRHSGAHGSSRPVAWPRSTPPMRGCRARLRTKACRRQRRAPQRPQCPSRGQDRWNQGAPKRNRPLRLIPCV